ncbi:dynein light chain Tctex-type 1-like [Molossus molossus]|uniref:dynein light chain Tctex-type 1-like n=1 Tax=Molossus molossus TaxID=27622 RepID=UPI001747B8F1|nr:dynein light chain Tctex-type 1-like [Molossus molossus]
MPFFMKRNHSSLEKLKTGSRKVKMSKQQFVVSESKEVGHARGEMEDYHAEKETTFIVDEVSSVVEAVEGAIGGSACQHGNVNQWSTDVVEQTGSQLTKLGKPFKYIETCVVKQKNGAGLPIASSCVWDSSADGGGTV